VSRTIAPVDGEVFTPSCVWLFFALNNVLLLWLLIRFGALVITAPFVINTLWFPMTTDLSSWYAGSGLLALGTVIAVAGYGFYFSLAGQCLARAGGGRADTTHHRRQYELPAWSSRPDNGRTRQRSRA